MPLHAWMRKRWIHNGYVLEDLCYLKVGVSPETVYPRKYTNEHWVRVQPLDFNTADAEGVE